MGVLLTADVNMTDLSTIEQEAVREQLARANRSMNLGSLETWQRAPRGDWSIWALVGAERDAANDAMERWFWGNGQLQKPAACAAQRGWYWQAGAHEGKVIGWGDFLNPPMLSPIEAGLRAVVCAKADCWSDEDLALLIAALHPEGRLMLNVSELGSSLAGWQAVIMRSGLPCVITGPRYAGLIHGRASSIGLTQAIRASEVDRMLDEQNGAR